tara:strand:- start:1884 stop:3152 length:1269 start_codon:yes stop_codon:yes gene_type:complete
MASSSTQILKKVGIKLTTPKKGKSVEDKPINFPLMSLLEDLKNMKLEKRVKHLFAVFGSNYFQLNFDTRRMLFSPFSPFDKRNRGKKSKEPFAYAECGGVLIDYVNCEVMSIAPSPITSTTYGNVSNKYNYYPVYHGTQLTLYWDKHDGAGKWCLQSANGIDVSDKVNRGIAFKDAFAECIAEMNIKLDKCDKKSSHTFVIRHPKLHPLREKPDMYAVQLVSVKLEDVTDSISLYKLRNNMETINDTMNDLITKDFKQTVKNYRKHLSLIQIGDVQRYAETGETFFGVIARSRTINDRYPAGISIIIESDLQKALRQCVYNHASMDDDAIDLANWAYQSKEYLLMFPEKKEQYEKFDKHFLPKVVDQIFANDPKDTIQDIRVKLLKEHPNILTTEHARANVIDLIRSREYTKEFIMCMNKGN